MASSVLDFIHSLSLRDVPFDVQHTASRCLLDLSATLVAGHATELSRIARDVAALVHGDRDVMSLTGLADRFLPAGFYYKTFMRRRAL